MIRKVDRVPPNHNRQLRMHWAARERLNESWRRLLLVSCGRNKVTPWEHKARLRITLHLTRLRDKDNLYGSVKPVVDALVKLGWLVDDSPEWCELDVDQKKGPQATEIDIRWE